MNFQFLKKRFGNAAPIHDPSQDETTHQSGAAPPKKPKLGFQTFNFSEVLQMNSRIKHKKERKKISNIFFVCSLPEHMRVYHCLLGATEGGVSA